LMDHLPVIQKISFLSFLLWFGLIALHCSKKRSFSSSGL
jgi:hypothetical protein